MWKPRQSLITERHKGFSKNAVLSHLESLVKNGLVFISTGHKYGTVLLFRNKHRDEINMGTETKGPSLLVFHEVTK